MCDAFYVHYYKVFSPFMRYNSRFISEKETAGSIWSRIRGVVSGKCIKVRPGKLLAVTDLIFKICRCPSEVQAVC